MSNKLTPTTVIKIETPAEATKDPIKYDFFCWDIFIAFFFTPSHAFTTLNVDFIIYFVIIAII
mgnify:CR=1 FL=1